MLNFCYCFTTIGHRILYDFDKFGDSPACLANPGSDLSGRRAFSHGYGFTEHGTTSDVLLGVNLTVMTKVQSDYLGLPVEGPYKPDHYRY